MSEPTNGGQSAGWEYRVAYVRKTGGRTNRFGPLTELEAHEEARYLREVGVFDVWIERRSIGAWRQFTRVVEVGQSET